MALRIFTKRLTITARLLETDVATKWLIIRNAVKFKWMRSEEFNHSVIEKQSWSWPAVSNRTALWVMSCSLWCQGQKYWKALKTCFWSLKRPPLVLQKVWDWWSWSVIKLKENFFLLLDDKTLQIALPLWLWSQPHTCIRAYAWFNHEKDTRGQERQRADKGADRMGGDRRRWDETTMQSG